MPSLGAGGAPAARAGAAQASPAGPAGSRFWGVTWAAGAEEPDKRGALS